MCGNCVFQVHTGHDDATLARLQDELDMVKISQDADRVPSWLKCTKTMIPDFVCADPKVSCDLNAFSIVAIIAITKILYYNAFLHVCFGRKFLECIVILYVCDITFSTTSSMPKVSKSFYHPEW